MAFAIADQTVVGDRYFVGVSSEIVDCLLWAAEGGFGINDPVLLACRCKVLFELGLVVEITELAVEAQLGLNGRLQGCSRYNGSV